MKGRKCDCEVGATSGCTLHLLERSLDDGLPHGVKANTWLSFIRTAMLVAAKGRQGGFKLKQKRHNIPIVTLGYWYSNKNTLCFVMAPRRGSTKAQNQCIMKYKDGFQQFLPM
jgi:hypothetical protein